MAETEAVLLRRFARTGDAEAFAEIIRRHAGLVYGAALRILTDMDRAADVAQETFLQLTKDAGVVSGSLPGWLHRVATHKAIDQMRRETSRRHRETAYMANRRNRVAEWKDISPYVDAGLNELDPEIRDILIAHFLEGQTTRHIAAVRGISQATVSRRIEAGVANLRGVLRRRGIIVAAGALGLLLGEGTVKAAPATLMAELGKIALVGGHAAAVSTAGGLAGLRLAVSGVLAGIKGNAAAVAAVVVIGAGSVVTYRYVTKPPSAPANEAATTEPLRQMGVAGGMMAAPPRAATAASEPSGAARRREQMATTAVEGAETQGGGSTVSPVPVPQSQANAAPSGETPRPASGYGDLAHLAVPADPHAEPNSSEKAAPIGGMAVGMMGGHAGYRAIDAEPPPDEDPNDSNDRDEDEQ